MSRFRVLLAVVVFNGLFIFYLVHKEEKVIAERGPFNGQLLSPLERRIEEKPWIVEDFSIAFVAVISMQRSSSTFLSAQVLAGDEDPRPNSPFAKAPFQICSYRHLIHLNEIFLNNYQQSKNAWPDNGMDLLQKENRTVMDLSSDELVTFLLRVANRQCRLKIEMDLKSNNCPHGIEPEKHFCVLIFKQFDFHLKYETHAALWEKLPNLRVVLLERNLFDRWKSYRLAMDTGDWAVIPTQGHKTNISCSLSSIPEVEEWFKSLHLAWYSFVRPLFSCNGTLNHIPTLDVSYASVVSDPLRVRRRAIHTILAEVPSLYQKPLPRAGGWLLRPPGRGYYFPTGSFYPCTSGTLDSSLVWSVSDVAQSHEDTSKAVSIITGTIVVSCRNITYKYVEESFRTSGSIIAGVLSSATGREKRDNIRIKWAKANRAIFFVVAGSWDAFKAEFVKQKDLIWIDIVEEYFAATEKTAAFFGVVDIASTRLSLHYDYVYKTDDTSYVPLDRIATRLSWISIHENRTADYWGSCEPLQTPIISDESLMSCDIEDEYQADYFPLYCQGTGYALSRKFLQCAVEQMPQTKYLMFEDVFVGVLAERCRVSAIYDDPYVWSLQSTSMNKERAVPGWYIGSAHLSRIMWISGIAIFVMRVYIHLNGRGDLLQGICKLKFLKIHQK